MKVKFKGPAAQSFDEKPEFPYGMQLQPGDEYEFTDKEFTLRIQRKVNCLVAEGQMEILDKKPIRSR